MQNHRTDDPLTSVLAGSQIDSSGVAQMQRNRCLEAVTALPGLTAREIEDLIDIKAHKRLPELRQSGFITNGPARHCQITGRRAMTWFPINANTGAHECH